METGTFSLQQNQHQYFELLYCHPESCNTLRQSTRIKLEIVERCAIFLHAGWVLWKQTLRQNVRDGRGEAGRCLLRINTCEKEAEASKPGQRRNWCSLGQASRKLWSEYYPLELSWWQGWDGRSLYPTGYITRLGLSWEGCDLRQGGSQQLRQTLKQLSTEGQWISGIGLP